MNLLLALFTAPSGNENYGRAELFHSSKDFVCIERLINACLRHQRIGVLPPHPLFFPPVRFTIRDENIFRNVNIFRIQRVFFSLIYAADRKSIGHTRS